MTSGFIAAPVIFLISMIGLGCAERALAQKPFSAQVVEEVGKQKTRPVRSKIEYEARPDVWLPIRETGDDGLLAATCPGQVPIRANAWPEFRPSEAELCGGNHKLKVARRPVSTVAAYLPEKSGISLDEWVQASATAAISEARREPGAAQSPGLAVFGRYVRGSDEISPKRREVIETRLLNAWSVDFQKVDANGDRQISEPELRAAMARPN